jgi:hypothetical protein
MCNSRFGSKSFKPDHEDIRRFSRALLPVFVMGIPRSGTTLLQSLLDGHPQILTDVGESRFFNWYYPKSRRKRIKDKIILADKYLLHTFDPEGAYYKNFLSHIPHEDVREYFINILQQSNKKPKDFLESYILAVGLASGSLSDQTIYWLEKTPFNEYFLDKIIQWWPEARYIHVVRDPRDVYSSYKFRDIKEGRKITPLDAFAFVWSKSIKVLNKYRNVVGSDKYYVLKYEDLVQNLEGTISQVVAFLNIQDSEILRKPTKGLGKVTWGGNSATGEQTYHVHKASLDRWKSFLNEDEIGKIENTLRKEMICVGYEVMNVVSPLRRDYVLVLKKFLRGVNFSITRL